MDITTRTWMYLCFCLCSVASLDTTVLAFSQNTVANVKIYINIVNPLDRVVSVNISAPRMSAFTTRQELVAQKDIIVIEMDKDYFEITGTGKSDKGIVITSEVSELLITGLSTAYNSGDMYFIRNASQLGTEYMVITHCDINNVCQFTVVSNEDNTLIEIIFPRYFANTILFEGTYFGPGDVMNISLQESQTFQIQSTTDLSGVKIVSTNKKRFSVLAGSSLTSVRSGSGRDYIADMVPPMAAWGNEYILVRRNLIQYLHDYVKFLVSAGGANISIIGCGPVHYHQIPEFQTYLFNITCERVHVLSDEPVLISHFPVGVGNGDPGMFFPTPVNYFASEYTVYVPPGFENCMVSFVIETRHVNAFNFSTVRGTITEWKEIDQSVYSTSWAYDVISGVIKMANTSPFGGHVICEKAWALIAFPIGLGNWSQNETLDFPPTSTTAATRTTENVFETTIEENSTEALESSTGSTDPNDVTTFSSIYVPTDDIQSTYADGSTRDINYVTVSSNTVSDVTTSEIHSNVNDSALNCVCCKTPSYSDSDLPPPEVLLEIIAELKKTLSVPKKTTSNYVRKLTSAWDTRTSSAGIGALGIVILCVIFGSIAALDLATLFQKRR